MHQFHYILVGGGLQNGLIALAILERFPETRIAVIERGARLGGNHIWCFHADDVSDRAGAFVGRLVAHRWPGYDVRFPNLDRRLEAPYAAVTSARFDQIVRAELALAPGAELMLGGSAVDVGEHRVVLADGRVLDGEVVIDARGPVLAQAGEDVRVGYQKFIGLELDLEEPTAPERPVLMDAKVPQVDGFRFFYVLPLAPDRILIEDTYFSDRPGLDRDRIMEGILAYAAAHGHRVRGVARQESGVLPLPLEGLPHLPAAGPLVAGYRGGFFHPVTGYSFPAAARLAELVAELPPHELFGPALRRLHERLAVQVRFGQRLNRMLFNWFEPAQRYNVLERFYRLPAGLIRRFYAMELGLADRARVLIGRPPRGMSWRAALGGVPASAEEYLR